MPGLWLIGGGLVAFALAWHYRPRFRSDLSAFWALALVCIIFFAPVMAGVAWLPRGGGDLVSFLWPNYRFAARSIWAGRLPLWNPHQFAGAPFAADNQSGLFYPPNVLMFILAPAIPYHVLEGMVILHVWLAGVGMYIFMRHWLRANPVGRTPARLGGRAFMLSDIFVTHLGNLNLIEVAAYLPWVVGMLWQGLRLWHTGDRSAWRWNLAAGAAMGVSMLAGHAQMSLFLAMAVVWTGLWWTLSGNARGTGRLYPLGAVAMVILIGMGAAAVMLIPAAELTQFTARADMSYEEAARYSLPPVALAGAVVPGIFGRGPDGFWAPWDRVEVGYAGLVTLVLAAVGVAEALRARGRAMRLTWFWVALGAGALLLALGPATPIHGLAYRWVPGMGYLRAPARLVLLVDFSLAALATLGLDAFCEDKKRHIGVIVFASVVITAAGIALGLIGADGFGGVPPERAGAAVIGVGLAVIVAFGVIGFAKSLSAGRFAVATVALLTLELILNGATTELDTADPYAGYDHPLVVEWLRGQEGLFRIEGASGAWQPDAASYHGFYDIYGLYNPLIIAAYNTYHWAVGYRGSPAYNFQGARYVISDKGQPRADSSFVPAFDGDPALTVYENTNALPLAHLVPRAISVDGPEDAWEPIHEPDWDPTAVVYVEGGPELDESPPQDSVHLRVLRYEPDYLAWESESPTSVYLVASEVYYPGWEALVDGEPAPIYRANTVFRAILLPPGRHVVEMRFRPLSFGIGALISAITWIALFFAARRRLAIIGASHSP